MPDKKTSEAAILEKVADLKKKHKLKEVFVISSEDKIAYIKKPSREQMKFGMAQFANDPIGLTEHVLKSGWLEGDEELITEDEYFYAISSQVDALLETKAVELKKY